MNLADREQKQKQNAKSFELFKNQHTQKTTQNKHIIDVNN